MFSSSGVREEFLEVGLGYEQKYLHKVFGLHTAVLMDLDPPQAISTTASTSQPTWILLHHEKFLSLNSTRASIPSTTPECCFKYIH